MASALPFLSKSLETPARKEADSSTEEYETSIIQGHCIGLLG